MSEFGLGSDPRLLYQQLKALDGRVKTLEAKSMAFASHQQGPLPGFLRAIQLNDISQPGSMWMNFTNAGPGLGPYSAVTDTNNVVRAEWGNLAANGVSPAQYGFRANNASGTPIFDSLGVLGIPKNIAEVINTVAVQGTNSTFADVTGAVTPTFTLSRQANLLTMAMGRVACQPANSNDFALLGLRCGPNTTTGAPGEVDAATTTVMFVPYCMFFWTTLAAGSYTAALQANAQGGVGAQWNVAYADVAVFQFGG